MSYRIPATAFPRIRESRSTSMRAHLITIATLVLSSCWHIGPAFASHLPLGSGLVTYVLGNFGGPITDEWIGPDVNEDGLITSAEVTWLLGALNGGFCPTNGYFCPTGFPLINDTGGLAISNGDFAFVSYLPTSNTAVEPDLLAEWVHGDMNGIGDFGHGDVALPSVYLDQPASEDSKLRDLDGDSFVVPPEAPWFVRGDGGALSYEAGATRSIASSITGAVPAPASMSLCALLGALLASGRRRT